MCDGKIARLTKTQSPFGSQLDSLADAISFGIAPALIIYKWALWSMGIIGFISVFIYIICGIVRLAIFNIKKNEDFFEGLPIPVAAIVLVNITLIGKKSFNSLFSPENPIIVSFITIIISLLMISNIKYYNFKNTPYCWLFFIFLITLFIFLVIYNYNLKEHKID
jgi:CDP-diacylglycerol--serine O-phosphatidyltransferase